MLFVRKSKSKSKSKSPERQPDYELLPPSELRIEPSDYSNYLSNNTYHPSPVIYNERLHKPVKRNYAYLEQNTWGNVPLTPESQKSPSEKSPSKKRKRVVSKKNRGRGRHLKGGNKRTIRKN